MQNNQIFWIRKFKTDVLIIIFWEFWTAQKRGYILFTKAGISMHNPVIFYVKQFKRLSLQSGLSIEIENVVRNSVYHKSQQQVDSFCIVNHENTCHKNMIFFYLQVVIYNYLNISFGQFYLPVKQRKFAIVMNVYFSLVKFIGSVKLATGTHYTTWKQITWYRR